MSDARSIPLHNFHAAHGARFVPFGGWNMPVQYTSILSEHKAVREAVGLFDVSHMGEFHVSGTDAACFLDRLLVNRIADAPVGKAIYSPMCANDGGVVDDLIVYRTADDIFWSASMPAISTRISTGSSNRLPTGSCKSRYGITLRTMPSSPCRARAQPR